MIKIIFHLTLTLTIWLGVRVYAGAQKPVNSLPDNKLQLKYEQAKKDIRTGNYDQALKLLDEVLAKYPDFEDAMARKATVLHLQKNYDASISAFKQLLSSGNVADPEIYFSLALVYQELKQFENAADMLEKFLQHDIQDKKRFDRASELLSINRFRHKLVSNPVQFSPVKLSGGVASTYSEYTPSMTIDGNQLVFTRRINGQEDLFVSFKDGNDFGPAEALTILNTHRNEGAHCISADGSILIFTACDRTDSYGGCDLYSSAFENGLWTKPFNMGKRINTPAYESQPGLSADGRTLYFTSNRTGGFGGKDIWISHLDDDNRWTTPYNAGPAINTAENDETPFIHADGSTLYFRSNGWPGMGDYDIFFSKWSDDTGEWLPAVNIGYPVNTEFSEGGLTVSPDGSTAFFASDMAYGKNDKNANLDIYSFEMDPSIRPVPSTYLKGSITDKISGKPLSAKIRVVDLQTGKTRYTAISDHTGRFITGLASGREYGCFVEKEGYQHFSQHFALQSLNSVDHFYELEITLQPIPVKNESVPAVGDAIVLQNIFFESGTANLLPTSGPELERLIEMMKKYPDIRITITGHTDNVGSEADNQLLSENRAKAVAEALITGGISATRITSQGKGESQPVATNNTPEGRQKNRRTEFTITGN